MSKERLGVALVAACLMAAATSMSHASMVRTQQADSGDAAKPEFTILGGPKGTTPPPKLVVPLRPNQPPEATGPPGPKPPPK